MIHAVEKKRRTQKDGMKDGNSGYLQEANPVGIKETDMFLMDQLTQAKVKGKKKSWLIRHKQS